MEILIMTMNDGWYSKKNVDVSLYDVSLLCNHNLMEAIKVLKFDNYSGDNIKDGYVLLVGDTKTKVSCYNDGVYTTSMEFEIQSTPLDIKKLLQSFRMSCDCGGLKVFNSFDPVNHARWCSLIKG